MKAAVLNAPGELVIGDLPVPQPGPTQILVRVALCGMCGTDRHTLAGTNALVRYPVTPGHEIVGTAVAVGDDVTTVRAGDRVAVDPSRSCGHCQYCRSGWPNLCPDKGGHGSRLPGGFAESLVADETACVPFSPAIPWERAVLAEPMACVLHGMDRLGSVLGKSAVVFGAGPIGMLAATLLRQNGASSVGMVEPSAYRRDVATEFGFTTAASAIGLQEDPSWDVVVDATGVPAAIEDGISRLRRAGTALLLGVAGAEQRVEISPYLVNWHELTIIGSMAVRHSFHRAVRVLADIQAPVERLVTHVVPLSELHRGVDLMKAKDSLKVAVSPGLDKPSTSNPHHRSASE